MRRRRVRITETARQQLRAAKVWWRRHALRPELLTAEIEEAIEILSMDDASAAKLGLIRVVDESGDDCLFPRALFADIRVPAKVAAALSSGR